MIATGPSTDKYQRLFGQSSCTAALIVGKDIEGKAGDRVVLSMEGRSWCELNYPDWLSACQGTITRVDKDGRMCDVKWDDRDRPYHYHTGCFSMFHLALVRSPKRKCLYLSKLKPVPSIAKARAPRRAGLGRERPQLLLMR